MNAEYGWVKYVTKVIRTTDGTRIYETRLSDFPEIVALADHDYESLATCFEKLAEYIRAKSGARADRA